MPNVAQTFVRDEGARDAQARSFRLELTRWQQLLLTVDSTFATQEQYRNRSVGSDLIARHREDRSVPTEACGCSVRSSSRNVAVPSKDLPALGVHPVDRP